MARWLVVLAASVVLSSGAWAQDAKQIYEKKCKLCHSLGGEKGPKGDLGGPLDGVGAKHDEAWLRAYLKDPKSKMPNAKMPKVNLSDPDFDAMIKYLLSLTAPPPAK